MKLNMRKIIISNIFLLFILIIAIFSIPVFFFDQFPIKGRSMNPTLLEGDHILINKFLFGARIYKKYDFSQYKLESFRVPGIRKIRIGDIIVFNYTDPNNNGKIEFKLNYVYAKRCIGCPGDTIGIDSGFYYNASFPGKKLCPDMYQRVLFNTPDSLLMVYPDVKYSAVRLYSGDEWTVKDFGPLYVPARGNQIQMTIETLKLYEKVIEYETGNKPVIGDRGEILLDGMLLANYTFQENYYFMVGDNVLNSNDSRYIGFIPEDYIVGIATRVLFSKISYSNKIYRILKKILP